MHSLSLIRRAPVRPRSPARSEPALLARHDPPHLALEGAPLEALLGLGGVELALRRELLSLEPQMSPGVRVRLV